MGNNINKTNLNTYFFFIQICLIAKILSTIMNLIKELSYSGYKKIKDIRFLLRQNNPFGLYFCDFILAQIYC